MCGITGWINFKELLNGKEAIIDTMTKTLSKRGPDDARVFSSKHALLGHRRLAVIDLEGGKQPMTKEKNKSNYTITYNGELYNTEDIRKELLKRGYTFSSHSDTEVLLTSYIEWKEQCVDYLNGIYAFGIWDEEKESMTLFRDRLGVKPLFYTEMNGGLIFSSEIKAILAHPEVSPVINYEGLAEVLGLGPSRTPGNGVFKGIHELRPGHALQFTRNGLKIWRYWNVESKEHTESFDETVEHVRFLVTDAVERQLVSDVPLCTFLSGGLDSSIITAIAAKKYDFEGKKLHTYSIDYEDNEKFFAANDFQTSTDSFWIQKMTDTFNTEHHTSIIPQQTLIDYLTEAVYVRDLPGMADVDSSLLWFCEQIKQNFTVALSGECADEIFGGYPWFSKPHTTGFPWIRSSNERNTFLQEKWQQRLSIPDYVNSQYEFTANETPKLEGESLEDAKRRELFYLNMNWFMSTLLERKDRMSMGASLEVRVPFADHRVVEYAWNIPWEMKRAGDQEKGILRKAMEGVLPEEVLYRKKNPYPKTYHPAYTDGVQKWLKELLQDKSSVLHELFDAKQLQDLVESKGASFKVPWFGQLMAGPQLLAYLAQIHVWFKHYNIQLIES
ncbi:asparagine synthase [Ureibacillus massiliensis 4400831 = CIP 108448 = CCUG 49529]|uniref:asparagine synthase (glutamine-hydrolyzing) n=2 Tax=cellular organisms TaxID=131567 RepID=A0A0A3JRQ0_9BACL|nr:asparagine synthase (glutamine-hydrolyzing) [Ureibacillus massiliensis]KGR89697.1 asparagine synthase [Ureibacillus massiliensis 4400831 = CIP 108448 = CCUG 49529]